MSENIKPKLIINLFRFLFIHKHIIWRHYKIISKIKVWYCCNQYIYVQTHYQVLFHLNGQKIAENYYSVIRVVSVAGGGHRGRYKDRIKRLGIA